MPTENLTNIAYTEDALFETHSVASILATMKAKADCTSDLVSLVQSVSQSNLPQNKLNELFTLLDNYDINEVIGLTESKKRSLRLTATRMVCHSLIHGQPSTTFIETVLVARHRDVDSHIRISILTTVEQLVKSGRIQPKTAFHISASLLSDPVASARKRAAKTIHVLAKTGSVGLLRPEHRSKLLRIGSEPALRTLLLSETENPTPTILAYSRNHPHITLTKAVMRKCSRILLPGGISDVAAFDSLLSLNQAAPLFRGLFGFGALVEAVVSANSPEIGHILRDVTFNYDDTVIDQLHHVIDLVKDKETTLAALIDHLLLVQNYSTDFDGTNSLIQQLLNTRKAQKKTVALLHHLSRLGYDQNKIDHFLRQVDQYHHILVYFDRFDIVAEKCGEIGSIVGEDQSNQVILYRAFWAIANGDYASVGANLIHLRPSPILVDFVEFLVPKWISLKMTIDQVHDQPSTGNQFVESLRAVLRSLIDSFSTSLIDSFTTRLINIGLFTSRIVHIDSIGALSTLTDAELILSHAFDSDRLVEYCSRNIGELVKRVKRSKCSRKRIFSRIREYVRGGCVSRAIRILVGSIELLDVNECIVVEAMMGENNGFREGLIRRIRMSGEKEKKVEI